MDKFPRDKQNQLLTILYDKFPDELLSEEYDTLVKLLVLSETYILIYGIYINTV